MKRFKSKLFAGLMSLALLGGLGFVSNKEGKVSKAAVPENGYVEAEFGEGEFLITFSKEKNNYYLPYQNPGNSTPIVEAFDNVNLIDDNNLWTITKVKDQTNKFYIKDKDGKYLSNTDSSKNQYSRIVSSGSYVDDSHNVWFVSNGFLVNNYTTPSTLGIYETSGVMKVSSDSKDGIFPILYKVNTSQPDDELVLSEGQLSLTINGSENIATVTERTELSIKVSYPSDVTETITLKCNGELLSLSDSENPQDGLIEKVHSYTVPYYSNAEENPNSLEFVAEGVSSGVSAKKTLSVTSIFVDNLSFDIFYKEDKIDSTIEIDNVSYPTVFAGHSNKEDRYLLKPTISSVNNENLTFAYNLVNQNGEKCANNDNEFAHVYTSNAELETKSDVIDNSIIYVECIAYVQKNRVVGKVTRPVVVLNKVDSFSFEWNTSFSGFDSNQNNCNFFIGGTTGKNGNGNILSSYFYLKFFDSRDESGVFVKSLNGAYSNDLMRFEVDAYKIIDGIQSKDSSFTIFSVDSNHTEMSSEIFDNEDLGSYNLICRAFYNGVEIDSETTHSIKINVVNFNFDSENCAFTEGKGIINKVYCYKDTISTALNSFELQWNDVEHGGSKITKQSDSPKNYKVTKYDSVTDKYFDIPTRESTLLKNDHAGKYRIEFATSANNLGEDGSYFEYFDVVPIKSLSLEPLNGIKDFAYADTTYELSPKVTVTWDDNLSETCVREDSLFANCINEPNKSKTYKPTSHGSSSDFEKEIYVTVKDFTDIKGSYNVHAFHVDHISINPSDSIEVLLGHDIDYSKINVTAYFNKEVGGSKYDELSELYAKELKAEEYFVDESNFEKDNLGVYTINFSYGTKGNASLNVITKLVLSNGDKVSLGNDIINEPYLAEFTSVKWETKEGNNLYVSGNQGGSHDKSKGVTITYGKSGLTLTAKKDKDTPLSKIRKVNVCYMLDGTNAAGSLDVSIGEFSFDNFVLESKELTTKEFVVPNEALDGDIKICINCTTSSVRIYSIEVVCDDTIYDFTEEEASKAMLNLLDSINTCNFDGEDNIKKVDLLIDQYNALDGFSFKVKDNFEKAKIEDDPNFEGTALEEYKLLCERYELNNNPSKDVLRASLYNNSLDGETIDVSNNSGAVIILTGVISLISISALLLFKKKKEN